MSQPIKVVMVGPRGAGKTSILSVMLHDVQRFVHRLSNTCPAFADPSLQPELVPQGMSYAALADARAKLEALVEEARRPGASPYSIDIDAHKILGDRTDRRIPVVFRMGSLQTRIDFIDLPGGFFSETLVHTNAQSGYSIWPKDDVALWEDDIRTADVILLAIDATAQLGERPVLDEATYRYHSRITSLVMDSVRHSMTTLVFVPVKCEHLALDASLPRGFSEAALSFNPSKCSDLRRQVERLFPDLLAFVKNLEVWANVDAVFAPMITLGGIRCAGQSYDPARHATTVRFASVVPGRPSATPFHPMNCDKIFALCLLRAFNSINDEWRQRTPLLFRAFRTFRALLGQKTPFEVFFENLAEAIHFWKLLFHFLAFDPAAPAPPDGVDWKQIYGIFSKDVPEDGCAALNWLYNPLRIPTP